MSRRAWAAIGVTIVVAIGGELAAQGPPPAQAPQPPQVPRAAAPVDFTGYWVSVISEDWRWRMITPPKGDYANIPVNADARRVGDGWDPAKDEAAGEQCKAYAAPAIMREPGRVHITWENDTTLKMETDAGVQTRVFHFGGSPPPGGTPSWQGYSVAKWEQSPRPAAGAGLFIGLAPRAGASNRTLEVVTTQLRPGYLRKNGVPFSAETRVNEFYDIFKEPGGQEWFVVTTIVTDPRYLSTPWVTTSHFKKEPDASKWSPTPCETR
jgi:hypothetical protein